MDLRADLGGSGAQTMECSTDTFKQRHFRAAPCRLSPQVNLGMPSVRVHAREMFYGTNNHIGDVRFPLALPTLITVTLSEHAVSCVCVGDFRLCQTVRLAIPQVHCVFRPFSLGRDSTSSTRTQRRTLQRSSARKARRAVTASALALFGRALDRGLRGLQ